jgi:hypothetical protein
LKVPGDACNGCLWVYSINSVRKEDSHKNNRFYNPDRGRRPCQRLETKSGYGKCGDKVVTTLITLIDVAVLYG